MIEVQDIVADADMISPEPWTILRSVATFGWGGVQTSITSIPATGPVRVASNREIQMLPEADRVGSIRAFYSALPLYVTRGTQPVPVPYYATITGAIPGTVYTLSSIPPAEALQLTKNGLILVSGVDYALNGAQVTLMVPTVSGNVLTASWIVRGTQDGLSDVIDYNNEQYRILQVYRTQGSGYWKAIATRMVPA